MVDLKQVIAKVNSQRETEAPTTPVKKVVNPVPVKVKEEEEESQEEEVDEEESQEEDPQTETIEENVVPNKESTDRQIVDTIETLHNNGAFRYELLAIGQKIVTELQVLNYQLMKLSGGDDGKGNN